MTIPLSFEIAWMKCKSIRIRSSRLQMENSWKFCNTHRKTRVLGFLVFKPATLLKRDSNTVAFLRILWNFIEPFWWLLLTNEKNTNEKYTNGKYTNEKYTSEKNYTNKKYRNGKKGTNEKYTNEKSIRMKSIWTENSIEWKTALKCLFNKTKWKVHPNK